MITIEQCNCGYKNCRDYWLDGIGKFCQGSGFEKEDAQLIADLLNRKVREQHAPVAVCTGYRHDADEECRAVRLANGDVIGKTCFEPCSFCMGKGGEDLTSVTS